MQIRESRECFFGYNSHVTHTHTHHIYIHACRRVRFHLQYSKQYILRRNCNPWQNGENTSQRGWIWILKKRVPDHDDVVYPPYTTTVRRSHQCSCCYLSWTATTTTTTTSKSGHCCNTRRRPSRRAGEWEFTIKFCVHINNTDRIHIFFHVSKTQDSVCKPTLSSTWMNVPNTNTCRFPVLLHYTRWFSWEEGTVGFERWNPHAKANFHKHSVTERFSPNQLVLIHPYPNDDILLFGLVKHNLPCVGLGWQDRFHATRPYYQPRE